MAISVKSLTFIHFVLSLILPFTLIGQTREANTTIHNNIQQETNDIFDSLISIRRDLHSHPELAENEQRTAQIIATYLEALGLEVHTNIGGYGVIGILETNEKGKKIAWRADIDALTSDFPDPVDFKSERKGVRHICGHDVHTTIALGMANVLTKHKDHLRGTIYFIFQPAEENLRGAKAMINNGLFNLINPDEIYALHMAPMPEGIIATKGKNPYADYRGLKIVFNKTDDKQATIKYTKGLISSLQNVAPDSKFWDNRNLLDPNIGLASPNTIYQDYIIVKGDPKMEETANNITIKTYLSAEKDTQLGALLPKIRKEIQSSKYAAQFQDIQFHNEQMLVLNDEQLTVASMNTIGEIYGQDRVSTLYGAVPDGRSDDFAYFQQQIPGVYFLLGASNFQKGIISMPHAPNFAVDENVIKSGVQYFSSLIVERLKID
jgi:metal-dependent amidase/aminoacylase/carboxypeptidase family protein